MPFFLTSPHISAQPFLAINKVPVVRSKHFYFIVLSLRSPNLSSSPHKNCTQCSCELKGVCLSGSRSKTLPLEKHQAGFICHFHSISWSPSICVISIILSADWLKKWPEPFQSNVCFRHLCSLVVPCSSPDMSCFCAFPGHNLPQPNIKRVSDSLHC